MPVSIQPLKPEVVAPLRLDLQSMKRQSLDISPSRSSLHSTRVHTPSSSVPTTPIVSARPASPAKNAFHPGQSNTFLTELAAQERRVLELKEELQKAEAGLESLKKQWATHEATRKKNELRHSEQLQLLTTSLGGRGEQTSEDSSISEQGCERQRMGPPVLKNSQRTVFSGQRHARALSLLSPKDPVSDPNNALRDKRAVQRRPESSNSSTRPSTIHELGSSTDGFNDSDGNVQRPPREPPKDVLLETGKQLVGDFRNGLWTFFEDLRQVTIGDEALSMSESRAQAPLTTGPASESHLRREKIVGSKKSGNRNTDQHHTPKAEKSRHVRDPGPTPSPEVSRKNHISDDLSLAHHAQPSNTALLSSDSDEGGWDDLDSATPETMTGQGIDGSPPSDKSSPTTSLSSVDTTLQPNKFSVTDDAGRKSPWPGLTKISPSTITRTASTFMTEWEKSLAPDK